MRAFQFAVICFVYSIQAQGWATITIQNVSDLLDTDGAIRVPSTIPNISISPVVGYYDEEIHFMDATTNASFFTNVDDSIPSWVYLDRNKGQISSPGECITSSCFASIDDLLYTIYDDTDHIIEYDLNRGIFKGVTYPFAYPGHYCIVSDDRYLYAVGDYLHIIIIDTRDFDLNVTFSSAFIPNHLTEDNGFACSMHPSQSSIYIFTQLAVFSYSIPNDTMSILYTDMNNELPYEENARTAISGPNDLIWVQTSDYMYPFSSSTDRFLHCRAPVEGEWHVSLLVIDDFVLRFGGGYIIDDEQHYIRTTTMVNAAFHDDRFRLNDWYHPSYPIGFNYSDSFIAAVGNGVIVDLSSSDFNSIVHNEVSFMRVTNLAISCGGDTTCGDSDQGLSIDLEADMAQYIEDMNNEGYIKDMWYSIEATTLELEVDSTGDSFVCNSFLIYPVYLAIYVRLLSAEHFYLQFDYEYLCNGCNTTFDSSYAFESVITINAGMLGIDGEITMKITNAEDKCEFIEGDEVTTVGFGCDNYTLYELDEVFFDGEYALSVSSRDTFLESNEIQLELSADITRCPMGTGYIEAIDACKLCDVHTFSFRSDLRECESCAGLDGVSCDGSDVITIEYRYWLAAYRQSTETYLTLFDMHNGSEGEDDDMLVSHICGYGQCCDNRDGCDYVKSYNQQSLCATHRDITSPMCTACGTDGDIKYYELLSSNNCGECDYDYNLWHLIWIWLIAFIFTLYLAFVDAQPLEEMLHGWRHRKDTEDDDDEYAVTLKAGMRTKGHSSHDDDDDDDDAFESESDVYDSDDPDSYKKKQPRKRKEYKKKRMQEMAKAEERFKYFVADGYVAYSVLLLQIFPYYFQGYAELLQSEGSREYLSPIINLFNFNFVNNKVGSNEGFCFIPKQTALDEISVILLFPGLMWLSLLLLYMFCNKGTFCVQIQLKCCGLSTVVCNRPYIPIAFTRISMLVLGLVFRVLLQLVTCVKFDDALDQVPFYYGGYCHQAPWFLGFASMIIFLLFILSVYKKLASQGHDERFSQTNTYSKLVQAYKANYWYWEAIVTLRRFLLTMFMSLSFLGGGYTNLILCVVLLIFLFAQIGLNPYAHKRNNRVETFCLLSLLIGVIALNFDDIEDSLFVSFFLAVVVFVPVVLALLFSVQLGRRVGKYFHGDEQYYLDNHATEDDDEDDRKQPGGHRPAVSSEYKTEKMMQRVLKKVTTEKWLGSREPQSPEIDVMKTAPHQHSTDKGEYGRVMKKNTETTDRGYGATQKSAEMATLAAPEDSDSSCGLSEN